MPRTAYQYETSPRKYEPDYTPRKITKKKTEIKKVSKKINEKEKAARQKAKKAQEIKKQAKQIVIVALIFGMLLAVSYREISIMEMFNQKKDMETQLAAIEKENGQVEKNIKEVESRLEWNNIKQIATEQLGMQEKKATPVELDRTDNVETETILIQEEKVSLIEKIIGAIISK